MVRVQGYMPTLVRDSESAAKVSRDRLLYKPSDIRIGINGRRHMNLFDPEGTTESMEPHPIDGAPATSSERLFEVTDGLALRTAIRRVRRSRKHVANRLNSPTS